MLISALIILTLLSFGTILGFFALQGRIRAWRLSGMERSAYARWKRMTPAQKTQALKRIGVFPIQRGNEPDLESLDHLFDGVLATAREELRVNGSFDFAALNDELAMVLELPTPRGAHVAHG